MLSWLVRFSIRFNGVVIALACLVLGYGLYTLGVARLDVFPEFAPPLAIVQTEAAGLSAEQVEVLVTQSVENALGGTLGVETMKSKSLQGLSLITVTFTDATDVQRARQLANERLTALAASLPVGVKPPALLPLTSSTSVVLIAGLTSATRSLGAVHDFAEWTLKPHLMGLPGVADVVVFGGDSRQFQVQVDPQRLPQYGLSLRDVVDAAKQSTAVHGAGFVEGTNQRIVISTEGQMRTPEQLARTPMVLRSGARIHLGDVADVRFAPGPAVGAASIDGKAGVMLVIENQYGADPMAVTEAIDTAFKGLQPLLASERVHLESAVFRPASFIVTAVEHVRNALLIGGVLVVAVLFLFLFNLRTAAISAIAIPLSLLTAVILLHRLGVSLNTLTLGGLAIALGEVVDDAIIDVENIFRQVLNTVPGAVGVSLQSPPGTPQLTVRLRPAQLERYGLAPLDALDAVQIAFEGADVAQIYEGNRVYDVTVILDPAHRRSPADVGALLVRNGQGMAVPLRQLADITEAAGRSQIGHSGGQRLQTMTSGVRGRAISDFVRDAQARLGRAVSLPIGTHIVFAGEAQARARSQHDLLVNSALAASGIVVLLFLALGGARATLLVLLNLPFALVGGIATVLVKGANLSLGSLIGFVTLFGITLRNSIMLVSHYQHLVEKEGVTWGPEAALRGSSERLVPILMTAAVTALGLLPLALRSGEPGNEIEGPMAIVILGGLITSTLLNLLVLPALALRYGRFELAQAQDDLSRGDAAP